VRSPRVFAFAATPEKKGHDLLFLRAASDYNDALSRKKSRTFKPQTFRC